METVLTNKYKVSEEEFNSMLLEKMMPDIDIFYQEIRDLINELDGYCDSEWTLPLADSDLYIDNKLKVLMPDCNTCEVIQDFSMEAVDAYIKDNDLYKGLPMEIPMLSQLREKRSELNNTVGSSYIVCICDDRRSIAFGWKVVYNPNLNEMRKKWDQGVKFIPIANLKYKNGEELLLKYLIPYEFSLKEITEKSQSCLHDLIILAKYSEENSSIATLDENNFLRGMVALMEKYINGSEMEWTKTLQWELFNT